MESSGIGGLGSAQQEPMASFEVGPGGPRAGFWRRFAAVFLDGLIVSLVAAVLAGIVGAVSSLEAGIGVFYLLAIAGSLAYFTYFEGGPSGQTPGKKALSIRVVDASTGGPIGYGRGFLRQIGKYVSQIVIYIGYLWMLWDKEKQTWHDKMASDVVVPTSAYPTS